MSVDSGFEEEGFIDFEKKLSDVEPASDQEVKRLNEYIKNAQPNWILSVDAKTLKSLLLRIETNL